MTQGTPIWKRHVYDTLASALGATRVIGLVQRFRADLRTRFADETSRDVLRLDAHATVSVAGMLGFEALSDAAKVLEHACADDADVVRPLEVVLSVRRATEQCLAELLPGEPPEASQLPR